LFDTNTGTFVFGWDATRDRLFGWEDGAGNYIVGHMNYLVNEFRGPLMFVALRHGFPVAAVANCGFWIKPYRMQSGVDIYTLATWEGSAFQSFGLTLFMQELENPGWRKILNDTLNIELDFAARNQLPGFLSEAYSGRGVEYTGIIGIPDLAITDQTRITNAPSLYTLGAASQIAPDRIEDFLATNWPTISRLFTKHGPWEGLKIQADVTRWGETTGEPSHECRATDFYGSRVRSPHQSEIDETGTEHFAPIKHQTTAHTLALILGGIGSAPDNMRRYLEFKRLNDKLLAWYKPGEAVDFLSPETKIVPWTSDGSPIHFSRNGNSFHIEDRPLKNGRVTLTVPQAGGVNLSGGRLIIRYRASAPIEPVIITLKRAEGGPYMPQQFANEIHVRFAATQNGEAEISIPLPATPGLVGTRELVIAFGRDNEPTPVDLTITALKFVPW